LRRKLFLSGGLIWFNSFHVDTGLYLKVNLRATIVAKDGTATLCIVWIRAYRGWQHWIVKQNDILKKKIKEIEIELIAVKMIRYEGMQGILKGEYHCTVDLLFDWFANKNKNCQLLRSRFQTSQTGGQQYSDTSPFSIPWCMYYSLLWNWCMRFINLFSGAPSIIENRRNIMLH